MTKQSIHHMPVLGRTLRRVDKHTQERGLIEALRQFTDDINAKLICEMSEKTRKILATEAVVLIGNHPTDSEPFVLFASLPPRRNVKLIVSDCMTNLSRAIDKHLIPVHVRYDQIHNPVGWRPTAVLAHATTDKKVWTNEEAHDYNVSQMKKASKALSRGDLLMIFPGRRVQDGRWFPGVGHLIKDAKTERSLYAVFADVHGTSHWDFLRLMPVINKRMRAIRVRFSEPIKVNSYQSKEGKAIAHLLEDKYQSWLRGK